MKNLSVLGSTGSIGVSTLDVVAAFPDLYNIVALSAGRNLDLLVEQIVRFRPQQVSVIDETAAQQLSEKLKKYPDCMPQIGYGAEGLIACATEASTTMVVAALVGAAGLVPTMAAIRAGKDIALANKETLVMAGDLIMAEVACQQVQLIPVDSEHSAIWQSLAGQRSEDVRRLILTASGGPFRNRPLAEFASIRPEDALAHPNWSMGRKISIDSATMMNKGLEVIEARWLFDCPAEQIAVHIHPESIVHSLVEYCDGALMAQLGIPDMKTPIAYALAWPQRLPLQQPPLDLCALGRLTFSQPDEQHFPCLPLAYAALSCGGTMPTVLNAANEVAVEAFLASQIAFVQIPRLIEATMAAHGSTAVTTIDQVLRADLWARETARELICGGTL